MNLPLLSLFLVFSFLLLLGCTATPPAPPVTVTPTLSATAVPTVEVGDTPPPLPEENTPIPDDGGGELPPLPE